MPSGGHRVIWHRMNLLLISFFSFLSILLIYCFRFSFPLLVTFLFGVTKKAPASAPSSYGHPLLSLVIDDTHTLRGVRGRVPPCYPGSRHCTPIDRNVLKFAENIAGKNLRNFGFAVIMTFTKPHWIMSSDSHLLRFASAPIIGR